MSNIKNKKMSQAEKEELRQKKNKRKRIIVTSVIIMFCVVPLIVSMILPFMY